MSKRVSAVAVRTTSLIRDKEHRTADDQGQSGEASGHHTADTTAPDWDVTTRAQAVEGLHQTHDLTRLQTAGTPWITFVA